MRYTTPRERVFVEDAKRQVVWLELTDEYVAGVFGLYADDPDGEHRERDADCVDVLTNHGQLERFALPSRWEVCGRCDGRGVHDHEAFADGLTARDFQEDPEFAADYWRGLYDVSCSECRGRTTVLEVDWTTLRDRFPVAHHVAETLLRSIEAGEAEAAEEARMRAQGYEL